MLLIMNDSCSAWTLVLITCWPLMLKLPCSLLSARIYSNHEGSLIIVEDIKELEEDYGNSMNLSSNGRKFPTCKITSSVKLFWPCIGAPSWWEGTISAFVRSEFIHLERRRTTCGQGQGFHGQLSNFLCDLGANPNRLGMLFSINNLLQKCLEKV
jgi:hypothetical protein